MMKKNYEKPTVEVVKFQYRDQVVVASGGKCTYHHTDGSEAAGCHVWWESSGSWFG